MNLSVQLRRLRANAPALFSDQGMRPSLTNHQHPVSTELQETIVYVISLHGRRICYAFFSSEKRLSILSLSAALNHFTDTILASMLVNASR